MFRSMLLAVAAALALPAAADITAVYAMAGGEQLRVLSLTARQVLFVLFLAHH
jgi:hypothetical protein